MKFSAAARRLNHRQTQPVIVRSRFAGGAIAAIEVSYTQPRVAVVADLRRRLASAQPSPADASDHEQAIALEVRVGETLTDRFLRAPDGTYIHYDLVADKTTQLHGALSHEQKSL